MNTTHSRLLEAMKTAALHAGAILMHHFQGLEKGEVSSKGGRDLVTIADKESEALLRQELGGQFPSVGFLGEEGGGQNASTGNLFIADPLDGTVNYVHGLPEFAVSIGYVEDGVPTVGVIYLPYYQKLFYAVKGEGAWRDGTPIHVSDTERLDSAMMATGFSCVRDHRHPDNSGAFCALLYQTTIRWIGSACVSYAFIAEGHLDGYWEFSLCPWDFAAGALLVTEAGGVFTGFVGETFHWENGAVIATNGKVHRQLQKILQAHC